jgi:hypothetical protein
MARKARAPKTKEKVECDYHGDEHCVCINPVNDPERLKRRLRSEYRTRVIMGMETRSLESKWTDYKDVFVAAFSELRTAPATTKAAQRHLDNWKKSKELGLSR